MGDAVIYKICFYVPKQNADSVKQAMFDAGGGRIGNYDHCCWQVEGIGQFRPLDGSNPHIGKKDSIEYVPEMRIELVCEEAKIESVIDALRKAHPYETPAYDVVKTEAF